MSNFGKVYDPNKRALNKILRENKYDPKDPYRLFREESRKQKRREKVLSKTRHKKQRFNLLTIVSWVVLMFILWYAKN